MRGDGWGAVAVSLWLFIRTNDSGGTAAAITLKWGCKQLLKGQMVSCQGLSVLKKFYGLVNFYRINFRRRHVPRV